jgi:hypothetical protein
VRGREEGGEGGGGEKEGEKERGRGMERKRRRVGVFKVQQVCLRFSKCVFVRICVHDDKRASRLMPLNRRLGCRV